MKAQQQEIREHRISARLTSKEMKQLQKAAKQSKITVADYVRLCIFG
jgi:uncharacterized protein (DUF1778 family)